MATFRSAQKAKMESLIGKDLTARHWEFLPARAERLSGAQGHEVPPPRDSHRPQMDEDKQASDYINRTAESWARGRDEDAERMPHYDHYDHRRRR